MKNRNIIFVIITLCILLGVNGVNAQTTPHFTKKVVHNFVNWKPIPVWIGPTASGEYSGIDNWIKINPGESISLNLAADSVSMIRPAYVMEGGKKVVRNVKKNYPMLAFRLTSDPSHITGQDFLEPFSKTKTTINIADTKLLADAKIVNGKKEVGIGFITNEAPKNTASCMIQNNTGYSMMFESAPLVGLTFGADSLAEISGTQKETLLKTGIKTLNVKVVMKEGDAPISATITLPIAENSKLIVLTKNSLDLENKSMKLCPVHIYLEGSPVSISMQAFKKTGTSYKYSIPGGAKGEKGKFVFLKYGPNVVTLNYWDGAWKSQTLMLVVDERSVYYLKYQDSGFVPDLVKEVD